MKLYDSNKRWEKGKCFKENYKGCDCTIWYIFDEDCWYFCCTNKELPTIYNSLCDGSRYNSEKDCIEACMAYIDSNKCNDLLEGN